MPQKQAHDLAHPTKASPPTAYAWHIDKTDGTGETVVAHVCILSSGVLEFYNTLPPLHGRTDRPDLILVRALSPRKWEDVQLVDTPHAAPVHLTTTHL